MFQVLYSPFFLFLFNFFAFHEMQGQGLHSKVMISFEVYF